MTSVPSASCQSLLVPRLLDTIQVLGATILLLWTPLFSALSNPPAARPSHPLYSTIHTQDSTSWVQNSHICGRPSNFSCAAPFWIEHFCTFRVQSGWVEMRRSDGEMRQGLDEMGRKGRGRGHIEQEREMRRRSIEWVRGKRNGRHRHGPGKLRNRKESDVGESGRENRLIFDNELPERNPSPGASTVLLTCVKPRVQYKRSSNTPSHSSSSSSCISAGLSIPGILAASSFSLAC